MSATQMAEQFLRDLSNRALIEQERAWRNWMDFSHAAERVWDKRIAAKPKAIWREAAEA